MGAPNLMGKTLNVTAYDAYAKYVVVDDDQINDLVTLRSVRKNDWDYTAPLLGEECVISRQNVVEHIEMDERFKRSLK